MVTKTDFVAIAAILKLLREDSRREGSLYLADNAISAIGHYFADANESFDITRFFRACGRDQ